MTVAALDALPLVAILRGLGPAEAPAVARALLDAGLRVLEVPLSGPEALATLDALVAAAGDAALVGAGTVLTPAQVSEVAARGGRLVVSPHLDPEVVAAARERGLVSIPGVFTPTEAFAALRAGADALKLFPAEALSPAVVRAWSLVLPRGTRLLPTGGVGPADFAAWRAAGATGVGLGTALYRPGEAPESVRARATAVVAAWRAAAPT